MSNIAEGCAMRLQVFTHDPDVFLSGLSGYSGICDVGTVRKVPSTLRGDREESQSNAVVVLVVGKVLRAVDARRAVLSVLVPAPSAHLAVVPPRCRRSGS